MKEDSSKRNFLLKFLSPGSDFLTEDHQEAVYQSHTRPSDQLDTLFSFQTVQAGGSVKWHRRRSTVGELGHSSATSLLQGAARHFEMPRKNHDWLTSI